MARHPFARKLQWFRRIRLRNLRWIFLLWEALSTPEEKCIDFPEQKYISEAGKKGR
jgi:hypothetical protein